MTAQALLLVVAIAVGVAAQGAFYPPGRWALVALIGCAALLTRWSGTWLRWDSRLVLVATALGCWTSMAMLRGSQSDAVLDVMAWIIACPLALLVSRRITIAESRVVLLGVVCVGLATSLVGLVGVLARHSPWADPSQGLWRAEAGTSYANATGVLLVMIALVALALLVSKPRSPVLAGASAVLIAGAGASLSRGAALAGLVAVVVLVLLSSRATLMVLVGPAVGAGVILTCLAPSMSAARVPSPWLAVVGLVSGPAVAAAIASRQPSPRVLARFALAGVIAGVVAGWLSYPALSSRLSLESPRWDTWAAAWPLVTSHLIEGVGPGRVWVAWTDAQGASRGTALLHNEYLQGLAELGIVGVLLLLAMAVVVLGPLRHSWHRPVTTTMLAAVTASTALLVGCAGDIFWHLTVLPVLASVLLGMAVAESLGLVSPNQTRSLTRSVAASRVQPIVIHRGEERTS